MSNARNLGIIGCSRRIESVLKTGDYYKQLNICALCDPDQERIEEFKREFNPQAKVYSTSEELAGDPDLDWVAVASWNSAHAEAAIPVLKAGKKLFLEKPVATTFDDCLQLARAHKKYCGTVIVGFTLRYSQLYRKIKKMLDSGAVGKIVSMEFSENLGFNHGGHIMSCWRRLREFTGSHILEKCSHDLDLANWMVESRVARVASFGGLNFFTKENSHLPEELEKDEHGHRAYCSWPTAQNGNPFITDKDIIDNQVVILEYQNGVRATFHTNLNAGIPERRMYILGSRGAIRADLVAGLLEYQKIGFNEPLENIDLSDKIDGHGGGDLHLVRHWEKMIAENAPSATPLKAGIEAAAVAFAADEAMLKGEIVDMKPYWNALDNCC